MSSEDGPGRIRLPQPEEIAEREKEDAMAAYLMMFASLAIGLPIPLVNLIASFIYFFVNRKSSPFVAFHSLQALLTHVPVVLLNAGLVGMAHRHPGHPGGFPRGVLLVPVLHDPRQYRLHRLVHRRPHPRAQGQVLLHARRRSALLQPVLRPPGSCPAHPAALGEQAAGGPLNRHARLARELGIIALVLVLLACAAFAATRLLFPRPLVSPDIARFLDDALGPLMSSQVRATRKVVDAETVVQGFQAIMARLEPALPGPPLTVEVIVIDSPRSMPSRCRGG